MRTLALISLALFVFLTACASNPDAGEARTEARPSSAAPTAARGPAANDESMADLTPRPESVPAAVRAIEDLIDTPSVILATEAEIYVSKNYQFEVGLSGDNVTSDLDKTGINERIALGNAIASIRNLQIRCDQRIRVRVADFGTKPFIRVAAKGHCSYVVAEESGRGGSVKRANAIFIENDDLRLVDQPLGLDASNRKATPAGAQGRQP